MKEGHRFLGLGSPQDGSIETERKVPRGPRQLDLEHASKQFLCTVKEIQYRMLY